MAMPSEEPILFADHSGVRRFKPMQENKCEFVADAVIVAEVVCKEDPLSVGASSKRWDIEPDCQLPNDSDEGIPGRGARGNELSVVIATNHSNRNLAGVHAREDIRDMNGTIGNRPIDQIAQMENLGDRFLGNKAH
jgi:hypothetical protein